MEKLNQAAVLFFDQARAIGARAGTWLMQLGTKSSRGQGLVEYALILVLVAIVVIGVLTQLGGKTAQVFDKVNCTMDGGEYHQDNGQGASNKCKKAK